MEHWLWLRWYENTEYMGEENIMEDVWTNGRARNAESKKYSGTGGTI
jgi:hypothetical protein